MYKLVDGLQIKLTQEEVTLRIEEEEAFLEKEAENKFKEDRVIEYPGIKEQLDIMFWDKINDTQQWLKLISQIKINNPGGREVKERSRTALIVNTVIEEDVSTLKTKIINLSTEVNRNKIDIEKFIGEAEELVLLLIKEMKDNRKELESLIEKRIKGVMVTIEEIQEEEEESTTFFSRLTNLFK